MNKSKFNNAPFVKRVEKPWGYELIFTTEDLPYTGKLMHLKAGTRQSLQIHDQKIETYYLSSGHGGVLMEDDYARPNETEEMRKKPNRGWK